MVTNKKPAFQSIKVLFSVPLSSRLVPKEWGHTLHSPCSVNSSLLSHYFQVSYGWSNSLVTEASYNCRWMWVDAMTNHLIGTSRRYQKFYHCKPSGALDLGISWRGWSAFPALISVPCLQAQPFHQSPLHVNGTTQPTDSTTQASGPTFTDPHSLSSSFLGSPAQRRFHKRHTMLKVLKGSKM